MSGKIKVLVIGPLPTPYHGVATFMRDLLAHKPGERIEWLHLDTSDHRDAANLGRWDLANIFLGLSHLAALAWRCLKDRPRIVYLPLSQNKAAFFRDALFILLSRLLGCRVVVHLHGGYFRTFYEREAGFTLRALARLALKRVAAAIVLGEEFRPIFQGLVAPERVQVVENGVADEGAPGARKAVAGTVLYMGTLTRTKGILELLRTFSLLKKKWPASRLKVAGDWNEEDLRKEAEALIAAEKLEARVEFVGTLADTAAKKVFFAEGDIFCLPTRYPYEGQPLVILEAMAAGLPILSTAQGVIASTVGDGCAGRVLPKEATPEMLSEALDEMLSDETRLRAYGEAARKRYLEKYTLAVCYGKLEIIFLKI
jgi:glycosyltransferase involved in cell wall biosynthesis